MSTARGEINPITSSKWTSLGSHVLREASEYFILSHKRVTTIKRVSKSKLNAVSPYFYFANYWSTVKCQAPRFAYNWAMKIVSASFVKVLRSWAPLLQHNRGVYATRSSHQAVLMAGLNRRYVVPQGSRDRSEFCPTLQFCPNTASWLVRLAQKLLWWDKNSRSCQIHRNWWARQWNFFRRDWLEYVIRSSSQYRHQTLKLIDISGQTV